jgi:hypothetical protein
VIDSAAFLSSEACERNIFISARRDPPTRLATLRGVHWIIAPDSPCCLVLV